jgi:hypothetical protein
LYIKLLSGLVSTIIYCSLTPIDELAHHPRVPVPQTRIPGETAAARRSRIAAKGKTEHGASRMTETKRKIDPQKLEDVLQAAQALFDKNPDWVVFFREVLGLGGIARRTFPTPDQLADFEHSDTYREIQRMLTRLRARPVVKPVPRKTEAEDLEAVLSATDEKESRKTPKAEETKVITVRLPVSLLEALQEEAHEHRTSVNKLCISKLLQYIDHDLIPTRQSGIQEGAA